MQTIQLQPQDFLSELLAPHDVEKSQTRTRKKRYIITLESLVNQMSLALYSVQIIKVSLLVRCPDFRGLNVCTLIQMGPWTSVLNIKVSSSVRCPDFRGSKCKINMDK